eukprot:SAG31_NODE_5606_length_2426_cov_1.296089_1_plen_251_part_00
MPQLCVRNSAACVHKLWSSLRADSWARGLMGCSQSAAAGVEPKVGQWATTSEAMFPVPESEPERLAVIRAGRLASIKTTVDGAVEGDVIQSTLHECCDSASERWGTAAMVNIVDDKRLFTIAGTFPVPAQGDSIEGISRVALRNAASSGSPTSGSASSGMVYRKRINLAGVTMARKRSTCQHVVAKSSPLVVEGMSAHPCLITVEDAHSAAQSDDAEFPVIGHPMLSTDDKIWASTPGMPECGYRDFLRH